MQEKANSITLFQQLELNPAVLHIWPVIMKIYMYVNNLSIIIFTLNLCSAFVLIRRKNKFYVIARNAENVNTYLYIFLI